MRPEFGQIAPDPVFPVFLACSPEFLKLVACARLAVKAEIGYFDPGTR